MERNVLLLLSILINYAYMDLTGAKKLSFANYYPERTDIKRLRINYTKWFSEITTERSVMFVPQIMLKRREILQMTFKNKEELNTDTKLYDITNEYVISMKLLTESPYFESIYSKVKDSGKYNKINVENSLALCLLSEVYKKDKSKFYYYIMNILSYFSPYLYEYDSIEFLKPDNVYKKLNADIAIYKQNYNDLRRLVYSYGDEFRNNFIGSFLFGDYLWAL